MALLHGWAGYSFIWSNKFNVCFKSLSVVISSLLQEGVTALAMASQNQHISVVKLLLEAKTNPNIQAKVILDTVMTVGVYFQCVAHWCVFKQWDMKQLVITQLPDVQCFMISIIYAAYKTHREKDNNHMVAAIAFTCVHWEWMHSYYSLMMYVNVTLLGMNDACLECIYFREEIHVAVIFAGV